MRGKQTKKRMTQGKSGRIVDLDGTRTSKLPELVSLPPRPTLSVVRAAPRRGRRRRYTTTGSGSSRMPKRP